MSTKETPQRRLPGFFFVQKEHPSRKWEPVFGMRSNHLFCRIILRKTASHFCWKCSRMRFFLRQGQAEHAHRSHRKVFRFS
ncbi:hypothetical protein CJU91_11175 [Brucella melitensis]|nr:hypothetical protein CJU91_11175 [Brucella melitensis]PAO85641.1 hypothetical protein CJU92_09945 [Brucella melitensis]